jgi:hypothetical protein
MFFFTKMVGAESDIEIEGEAVSRPLVQLVLHNKDNETEVGLLAEDRWVSHRAIALLRNSLKARVPLEGTCNPEEEEAIRKEMVAEFAQLPQKQRVMFGRKAIKNYRSRIHHHQKVQVRSAGEGSKRKSEQGDVSKGGKAPRTRAQAAVALEEERKQSTGSEVPSSIGVRTSEQGQAQAKRVPGWALRRREMDVGAR